MDSYLKGAQNAMYSLVDGASLQLEVKSRSLIKTKVCSLWETLFYLIFQSFPFGLKYILVIQQIEYLLYQAMKIQNWLIFKMCWILKQKEEQVLGEIPPLSLMLLN